MPISISYAGFSALVTPNTLVLTPNARTQKSIIAGFVADLAEGQVVRAPQVLALSQWLESLLSQVAFSQQVPRLVSNIALKTWLKELISNDTDWQLTNELGVAERVLEGYRLLCQWDTSLAELAEGDTIETSYFIRWVDELRQFCAKEQLIPKFELIPYLGKVFDCIRNNLPEKILLVGFNELTPSESGFFKLCINVGVEVESFFPSKSNRQSYRIEVTDFKQELDFAARYALKESQERPNNTIAVVVHQLASHLNQVHQSFSEVFQPDERLPWQPLEKIRYNVSAGQPLAEQPIILVALKLLSMNNHSIDLEGLLLLKNSSFIDWGEQSSYVKRFLHQQSLLGYPQYSLDRLLETIDKSEEHSSLTILSDRIRELKRRPTKARPMKAWSDAWKNSLRLWGWLQNYEANDVEQKLITEFHSVLCEAFELGVLFPKCNHSKAREFLFQLFKQKSFQLPSDRTNVHVLGVLEASGLEFDSLILVGFDRDNWPQSAKPNPFLPIGLQQSKRMPGSSAEREFLYAQDLSLSLLASAENIWITQSQANEDGMSNESSLFSDIPLSSDDYPFDTHIKLINSDYHWRQDEAIRLNSGKISGGAYLLGQYAACPFQAMSNFQFRIKTSQNTDNGIDPRVRGGWLHLAMEKFWESVQTQSALLELTGEAQIELVKSTLSDAQAEYESQLFANAPKEIIDLEFEKLFQQIQEWLEFDRLRSPFTVETEVSKTLSLGQLDFTFRIDRLDTNAQGAYEIIDYKTGKTDFKKWLGSRPQEAQMPAYVLACQNKPLASLSYAKLKTGEVAREGIWFNDQSEYGFQFIEHTKENSKDRTKSIVANPELVKIDRTIIEQWSESLTGLSAAIASGKMPVSPFQPAETCRFCEYKDFCRLGENQPEPKVVSKIFATKNEDSTLASDLVNNSKRVKNSTEDRSGDFQQAFDFGESQ